MFKLIVFTTFFLCCLEIKAQGGSSQTGGQPGGSSQTGGNIGGSSQTGRQVEGQFFALILF